MMERVGSETVRTAVPWGLFTLVLVRDPSAKRAQAHCSKVWSGEWQSEQDSSARRTVAAMMEGARSFQGRPTPAARCWQKSWS